MARDYKHRAHRRKKKHGAPWFGLFSGLLIGLFVAFLVFIKMQAGPDTAQVEITDILPPPAPAEDVRDVSKPEDKATIKPPQPRFDFYNLLPEMEVIVPDAEIDKVRPKPQPPAASTVTATTTEPAPAAAGTYYIQVGSFKNGEQADALKAKLALSGFEAVVHKASIEINSVTATYHRVRVGPFSSLDAANRTRDRLTASGVDSKIVEIKG